MEVKKTDRQGRVRREVERERERESHKINDKFSLKTKQNFKTQIYC